MDLDGANQTLVTPQNATASIGELHTMDLG